jgi:hypothetical protein
LVEKLTGLGAEISQKPVEDEETVHLSQAN